MKKSRELKTRKHGSFIFLMILTLCIFMSGCGNGKTRIVLTTGLEKDEVFRIGKTSCMLPEIMVYLTNTQNQYEKVYSDTIWDVNMNGVSMEQDIKDTVLARISKIKAMTLLAEEYGITLTEDEQILVSEAASSYYSNLADAEIEEMGVTEEIIDNLYREYALAEKIYDYIIRDVTPEISDDEARTITVTQILFKTYYIDVKGEQQKYGTDAKIDVYKKALSVKNSIDEGEDFDMLASEFNEAEITTFSFSKGTMEDIYEETAFNLGTGEISSIFETEEGYVILRCDNAYNREETDRNKAKLLEERKKQAFNSCYEEFVTGLDKKMNNDLWDSVTLIHDNQVTTSNFFDIYEEYFGSSTIE